MLNTFPLLLSFDLLVPLLFRIVLGVIFFRSGYMLLFQKASFPPLTTTLTAHNSLRLILGRILGSVLLICALFLVLGIRVQVTALILSLLASCAFCIKIKYPTLLMSNTRYYLLLAVMSFSLLFLGPGFFAFDLPL